MIKTKVIKKAVIIVISALLLMTTFAACKKTEPSDMEEKATEGKTVQTSETKAVETEKETEKEIPILRTYSSITITVPGASDITAKIDEYIMDKLGIIVEPIIPPSEGSEEKLNMLLASGDVDLFVGKWPLYKDDGVIIPLTDLLNEYGQEIISRWNAYQSNLGLMDIMKDENGEIWGIPRNGGAFTYPTWIRKDWMDELGIKMPETIDEMEAALAAFQSNDPYGNEETIPLLTDIGNLPYALSGCFIEGGWTQWLDETDNLVKPAYLDSGFEDFCKKMAEWYKAGYIYKEFAVVNTDGMAALIQAGKPAMVSSWISRVTLNQEVLWQNNEDASYVICEDGISGEKGLGEINLKPSNSALMITSACDYPEAAIKYIAKQYEDVEFALTVRFGIEGEQWQAVDADPNYPEAFAYELLYKADEKQYYGEYYTAYGPPMDTMAVVAQPISFKQGIDRKFASPDTGRAKIRFDNTLIYDSVALAENVPELADLDRMVTEAMGDFITGVRSFDEWNEFMSELEQAGVQNYVDELTRQYNELIK